MRSHKSLSRFPLWTLTAALIAAHPALATITVQNSATGFGNARFTGNSFSGGSGPGGGSPSSTSTQANVTFAASGGSGSTSGGLGDVAATVTYGSATTTVAVSANATEFRVHITGAGDVNAPAGYSNLQITASLSFFSTAIHITGAGAMPFTIQKTGDLAGVTWALVPEAGSGASIVGNTLTAGNYRFDQNADAQDDSPFANVVYSFGNGGTGNQHRTFSGDFALVLGSGASGVCCRGATCNATVSQAACTAPTVHAGAVFVSAASACNTAGNRTTPCCEANYNKSSGPNAVTVQDLFDFLAAWFAGC